jgi:hypothetical protein
LVSAAGKKVYLLPSLGFSGAGQVW